MDRSHLRVRVRELVGDFGRAVSTPVVDDDDFEVRRQRRGMFDGANHHARDGATVVVRREKHTETRGLWSGRS